MSQNLSRRMLLGVAGGGGLLTALEFLALSGPTVGERAAAAIGPGGLAFTGAGRGGIYVQTGLGNIGDFALTVPGPASGVVSILRSNDQGLNWTAPRWTAGTATGVDGVSATWSNYNHLEIAQVVAGTVQTWWRSDTDDWTRFADVPTPAGPAQGWPALVQTTFGTFGDFALVAPLKSGGLMFAWRRNDQGSVWQFGGTFGSGLYQGVALMQSNYLTNGKGNLELVAVTAGGTMEVWVWIGYWIRTEVVGSGLAGAPALVQSRVGTPGNFEVVVPAASGGLEWWTRNNTSGLTWSRRAAFGAPEKFWAAGLTIGPYGPSTDNHLEVAGFGPAGVSVFFRDAANAWQSLPSPRRALPATLGAADGTVSLNAVGILSTLLPSGKLLLIGFKPYNQFADADYRLYDPASRSVTTLPFVHDTFCAGLDVAADGSVLIAGGHSADALPGVFLIDPVRGNQRRYPDMPQGRWYPTVTTLADGRTLVIAGSLTVGVSPNRNSTYQVWNPTTRTMSAPAKTPVPFSPSWPSGDTVLHWYPFVWQLPDGRIMVHSRSSTRMLLDVDKATWDTRVWNSPSGLARTYPHDGSGVVLPLRHNQNYAFRAMISGGTGGDAPANGAVADATPATATAEIFDPATGWRSTGSMRAARVMHDCVLLPDGTVLAVGGGSVGHNDVCSRPVLYTEVFDPVSETWSPGGEITVPRGYHQTAVLLPDGSVAVAGRDAELQPNELQYLETRLEVFKPSYFFRGTRPGLTGTPSTMVPGKTYSVTVTPATGATVKDIVLLRAGSTTHGNNMGQRMVTVPFTVNGSQVSFTLPANANLLPPGGYAVFAVDSAGLPSKGQMTRLTVPGSVPAPWRAFGSVPATIGYAGGVFSLTAAGADIFAGNDQFAGVYAPVAVGSGGGVSARLLSQTDTDPWAKAGVFLRNDATAPGASAGYVVMVRTPGNGVSLQWDGDGNGSIDSWTAAAPGTGPNVWLKLTRLDATRVAGYYSLNGSTWTQVGQPITLAGAAARQDAGIIMTSHKAGTAGTATFDTLTTT